MHLRNNLWLCALVCFLCFDLFAQQEDPCIDASMRLFYKAEYSKAYEEMMKCYERDTNNIDFLEKLGQFSFRAGNFRKAKDWYHKLSLKDTNHITAHHYLGTIYEQEEYLPRALKHYSRLIEINPENPTFWKKTGGIYFKAGLSKEGLSYYQTAHELNPQDVSVIKVLAEYYFNSDQLESADSILAIGLNLDEENIGLILLSAKSAYKKGDFQHSCELLFGLTRKIDLSPYYNKMLGYSFLQVDSLDKAIFHLEKALVNDRNPESIHYYLGNAYFKKKELEYATHHYEKAIDAGMSDNLGLYHKQLASVYEKEKEYKLAIKHYKEAYNFSRDSEVLFFLGMNCDLYYKDKSMAINYFTKYASSDHPNSAYKKYAIERMRYLREIAHFTNKK